MPKLNDLPDNLIKQPTSTEFNNESQELLTEMLEVETTLRPKLLCDFQGQLDITSNLSVYVQAAKKRKEPLDHVLFYGPPGVGKTTLAFIIGNEYGSNVKITSGPAIDRVADLATILTNLEEGDILFIDEIHRLSKPIEEVIYPAMEDFGLDIILGKGPSARTLRLDLPKFTLVGATTKIGMISNPLRDRFGCVFRLNYYSEEELSFIIKRSAKLMDLELEEAVCEIISKRSRGTPRVANRILKRLRDYSQVHNKKLNKSYVEEALKLIGINENGLDNQDIRYLQTLLEKFEGGPVGLSTLSASLSEDSGTIEEVIEPYLLQLGLIQRTGKGRQIVNQALVHEIIETKY